MPYSLFDDVTTRRQWLRTAACGFGGLAAHDMVARLAQAAADPLATGLRSYQVPATYQAPGAHHAPRAQRVIFLFMAGGPSQPDLFDPKPLIAKNHAQKVSAPIDDILIRVGVENSLALAPVAPIRPRGESGLMISDLLPQLASVADELCLLRAMHTDNKAHAPAVLQLHTGMLSNAHPSMGSWISYGLGTENDNLPSFITIHPPGDARTYGAAYLPAAHQGTSLTVPGNEKDSAIKYLRDASAHPEVQRRRLNFLQNMNRRLLSRLETDAQMEGIIESFELAFRMQSETPQLVDLSQESATTLELYGIGDSPTDRNGRACLLARRMSEAGVRFVQVTMGGWDHHGNIRSALPNSCTGVDRPIAGLLKDLRMRGLLDDTLVVWSGEFGRTQWSQDLSGTSPIEKHGREHQQEGYCAWLAGGGVQRGIVHGQTDEFGYRAMEGKVHLYDLHATVLHLLGLDHKRITYRHAGRDFRLTDVHGQVVNEILA